MSGDVPYRRLLWVSVFAVAFAFVESSVVVYLRAIYYPEGFEFPLVMVSWEHLTVELLREAATILMLVAAGVLAGKKPWERFGYFLVAFGVWDIFYYVWLKVLLDWPVSILDWDVLFLIPVPWIGPVIAPVAISILMVMCGVLMVKRVRAGKHFRPTILSWALSFIATGIILYSFVYDTPATLGERMPEPYLYWMLVAGLVLYTVGFAVACRGERKSQVI
jgi:hypothetical protein